MLGYSIRQKQVNSWITIENNKKFIRGTCQIQLQHIK